MIDLPSAAQLWKSREGRNINKNDRRKVLKLLLVAQDERSAGVGEDKGIHRKMETESSHEITLLFGQEHASDTLMTAKTTTICFLVPLLLA